MSNENNNLYEFGSYKFDRQKQQLWRGEELIFLSPKASEVLNLLLEKNGEFASKQEIFETVWKDTFVEDGVLTQNIYTLRKALGNNADNLPIIENKTRLGYRITLPVFSKSESHPTADKKESGLHTPEIRRSRVPLSVVILFFVLLIGGILGWSFQGSKLKSYYRKQIETVKFTPLTNTGDLVNAVISPNGSVAVFTRDNGVFLRDIETEKEIKLDISNVKLIGSPQFSPDGNQLYFRNNRILTSQAGILRVSLFGGEPEEIIERSWGSFSLSPDGKKLAYILNVPPIAKFNLKVRNLETGEEKEFFVAEQPNSPCLVCSPAWSPDSEKIIFTTFIPNGTGQLFIVNLKNDQKDEIKLAKLRRFEQVAWLPDGESFIVSATEGTRFFHLWKVYYPDGEIEIFTNGLSNYGKVSISKDGKKILSLKTEETSNIYVSDADNLSVEKQITFGSQNSFGQNGLHWIDEKRILFSYQTEQNLAENLSILNLADTSKMPVTNDPQQSYRVPVSNGKHIYYGMNKDGVPHIFRMDMDGKNTKQMTSGNEGNRQSPRLSKDSRYLYYVLRGKAGGKIMRIDLETDKEDIVFDNPEFQPGPFLELSPDNKHLTFFKLGERPQNGTDDFNAVMTIVSPENTSDIKSFPVSAVPPIRRFSPDGKFVDYIYSITNATQIVRQSFDGSEPKPIYTSRDGQIFNFAWSKDGKQLAVAKGQQIRDAVLLTEF